MKNGVLSATPVTPKRYSPKVKEQVRAWAPAIGLRASARKFGVNEDTACAWAHREKWILPDVFADVRLRNAGKHAASIVHDAQDEVLKEQSRDTMLYFSSAALKASHQATLLNPETLLDKDTAIALEAHNRVADRTHGWTALRQQNQTQVAVQVQMPTAQEDAQRKAEHAKLDEIAALLRDKRAAKQLES